MTLQDDTPTQELTTAASVVLSDVAAAKVKSLLEQEGRTDLALRVAVQPGGCSGLRYQLFFDDRSLDGDVVTDFGGVNVVVDRMSNPYLLGASVDFVDTIEKQGFTSANPNTTGGGPRRWRGAAGEPEERRVASPGRRCEIAPPAGACVRVVVTGSFATDHLMTFP